MKDDKVPVHDHDHAEPTVIQSPDEDMTVLARWLQHGMEQGSRFWMLIFGVILALFAVAAVSSGLVAGKSAGSEAWTELTQAKTIDDRLKIAEAHPNTPAAGWAKLMSAREEYEFGVDDLTTPGKKDTAGPRLTKALKLFQEVAKEAGTNESQAVGGLFGAARTYEARNELDEAIKHYKLVIEKFPKSPEAKMAEELIPALEEPVNQMFYKELYAYKPPSNPFPPSGSGLQGPGGLGSFLNSPGNFGLGQPNKPLLPEGMPAPVGLDPPPQSIITPAPPLEPPKESSLKKEATPGPTTPAEPAKAASPKTELPADPSTTPK